MTMLMTTCAENARRKVHPRLKKEDVKRIYLGWNAKIAISSTICKSGNDIATTTIISLDVCFMYKYSSIYFSIYLNVFFFQVLH